MMNKIAYLFPGQGSQQVGMGADLSVHSPGALQAFEVADTYLGTKLSTLCYYGPEEQLSETIYTQPAIYVTSVAALRALREACAPEPEAVAGHSVGEYAALYAAGVMDYQTGLELVNRRAQEMHRAGSAAPGAMAAVLGLSVDDITAACREAEASGAGIVDAANFNGGGQVVISGAPSAVAAASDLAKQKGAKRVVPLNVSGAFHSRLMTPAARSMELTLQNYRLRPAAISVVSNVTGDYETTATGITRNLAAQIDHPVRWEESMRRLVADGFTRFAEVGHGGVLARLMKRIDPDVTIYSVGDSAGVAAFVAAMKG